MPNSEAWYAQICSGSASGEPSRLVQVLSTERLVSKLGIPNASLGCFLPTHQRFLLHFLFCFVLIVRSLPETFIHTMFFFFLNVLCFFSWIGRGHDLLFTHDTWLQLRASPECCRSRAGDQQELFQLWARRGSQRWSRRLEGDGGQTSMGRCYQQSRGVQKSSAPPASVGVRASVGVWASMDVQASFPGPLPNLLSLFGLYIPSLLQLTAWCRGFYRERGQDYSWSSMIIPKEKKINFINFVGRQR